MEIWIDQIKTYICDYFGSSSIIIYLYIGCLIYLCFCGKRTRRLIVYPSVILTIIIINPILYGLIWIKLIGGTYWRMLWMIPIIPVFVCAIMNIDLYIKKKWSIIVVSCVVIFFIIGKFENMYSIDNIYCRVNNIYKLPDSTVAIGERILEYDTNPILIAPASQYCYLRQYNGDIKLVFGRNAEYYIGIFGSREGWRELIAIIADNGGDVSRLTELANKFDVDFIVLPSNHNFNNIDYYGYKEIGDFDNYIVYQRKG